MTNDEAIKTLREDYCGNRIICELHPDQCNREDCEIWLAIKALAEQPIRVIETQPEITPDGTLNVSIDADIANVGRILLSQAGTQYGGLYYKDEQPEIIRCKDCKYRRQNNYGDSWCAHSKGLDGYELMPTDFCSRAERRTDD